MHVKNAVTIIILYRGQTFRDAFIKIREVRSIMSSTVNVIALTATATFSLYLSGFIFFSIFLSTIFK